MEHELGKNAARAEVKAYGAGVLSSFGEMEWACAEAPTQECRDAGSITTTKPGALGASDHTGAWGAFRCCRLGVKKGTGTLLKTIKHPEIFMKT